MSRYSHLEKIIPDRYNHIKWWKEEDKMSIMFGSLKDELIHQKKIKYKGNIYHFCQVNMAFNSNKIEGSKLTQEQTEEIFETDSFIPKNQDVIKLDDLTEMKNHFRLFDYMLDTLDQPLSKDLMIEMNRILKRGTSYEDDPRYNVGGFKLVPNQIVGALNVFQTSSPEDVENDLDDLLERYSDIDEIRLSDIIDFHVEFERIHPFGDGNGRTGRMIMFRECLNHNIMPFIILDEDRAYYMRGLREYDREKGYLTDTILHEQDLFESNVKYFFGKDLNGTDSSMQVEE